MNQKVWNYIHVCKSNSELHDRFTLINDNFLEINKKKLIQIISFFNTDEKIIIKLQRFIRYYSLLSLVYSFSY